MSFVIRVQREIKAKPLKAAGLGVLLVVAAYFWAPLVRGYLGGGQTAAGPPAASPAPTASAASQSTVSTSTSPGQAAAAGGTTSAAYDWRKYSKLIDEDAKMREGAALSGPRDPFVSPQPPAPSEPPKSAQSEAQPITPADAGLLLTTTLLGARKKIAEINGKSYTIGQRVKIVGDDLRASFRVVEIHPRRVILESQGRRYELKIPRPLLDAVVEAREADDDEVVEDEATERPGGESFEKKTADEPSKETEELTD
jgi:hypothetical protein